MDRMIVLGLLIVAAIVLVACTGGKKVDSASARELVSGGALLLDVRTPGEFSGGHIEGALNIPVAELSGRIAEVGDTQRDVVVYCRSGGRSARAKSILEGAGYTKVHDLGAMSRW